jgi:hypothetical protein
VQPELTKLLEKLQKVNSTEELLDCIEEALEEDELWEVRQLRDIRYWVTQQSEDIQYHLAKFYTGLEMPEYAVYLNKWRKEVRNKAGIILKRAKSTPRYKAEDFYEDLKRDFYPSARHFLEDEFSSTFAQRTQSAEVKVKVDNFLRDLAFLKDTTQLLDFFQKYGLGLLR